MFSKIECPVCGYEYLPAEIFVPRAIFGTPGFIRRDVLGKIEAFSGTKEDFIKKKRREKK